MTPPVLVAWSCIDVVDEMSEPGEDIVSPWYCNPSRDPDYLHVKSEGDDELLSKVLKDDNGKASGNK